MKKFVEKMENVKHGEFTIDGEKWTIVQGVTGNACGTSATKGFFYAMTNGVEIKRIYKSDVLKYDVKKAVALFN